MRSGWSVWVKLRQNFWKTHMCGAGVCCAKSYYAQSVQVCQNWMHINTLLLSELNWMSCFDGKNQRLFCCDTFNLKFWLSRKVTMFYKICCKLDLNFKADFIIRIMKNVSFWPLRWFELRRFPKKAELSKYHNIGRISACSNVNMIPLRFHAEITQWGATFLKLNNSTLLLNSVSFRVSWSCPTSSLLPASLNE